MREPLARRFDVVHCIPSPYRLHLFAVMDEELRARGFDFHVHFMSKGDVDRPSFWRDPAIPFAHTYWRDFGWRTIHLNPGMVLHLRRVRPAYVLIGSPYDSLTGALTARFVRSGVSVAWSEGNTQNPGRMGGAAGLYKRWVLKQCAFVAVPGEEGARHIALHQARTSWAMPRPAFLPNIVDERRFKPREAWSPAEIESVQKDLGKKSDDERICLCPARLERVKGLLEFVEKVPAEALSGWRVVVVGQGSLRERLDQAIRSRGLQERILIRDYVPYEEMPKYYAASDLFLLPSTYDPNPLSVVEAMHSGLPLALSTRAGNVREALEPGVNGWALNVDDDHAYVQALREAFGADAGCAVAKGRRSAEMARAFWGSRASVTRFLSTLGLE